MSDSNLIIIRSHTHNGRWIDNIDVLKDGESSKRQQDNKQELVNGYFVLPIIVLIANIMPLQFPYKTLDAF